MLLTEREKQVIELLAQGYNSSGIADKLCISKKSAKVHLHNIYEKNLIVRDDNKSSAIRAVLMYQKNIALEDPEINEKVKKVKDKLNNILNILDGD